MKRDVEKFFSLLNLQWICRLKYPLNNELLEFSVRFVFFLLLIYRTLKIIEAFSIVDFCMVTPIFNLHAAFI